MHPGDVVLWVEDLLEYLHEVLLRVLNFNVREKDTIFFGNGEVTGRTIRFVETDGNRSALCLGCVN